MQTMFLCRTCGSTKKFSKHILEAANDKIHGEVVMRCEGCNRRGFDAEGANREELNANTKKLQSNRRTSARCVEKAADFGESDEAVELHKRADELWNQFE